ncbi:hypothetical protein G9463_10230 [Haloarcula sp. JP-Z28]|uniref:hypothetical protein n=1 Tax=unclassified Haloarcula TaxID=2624677 RepID=UPI000EF194AF|nr:MULTISPECIES: hypothetical protein [unclassified Haloarcula]NHN63671.1 hypothetical protein [Haloarcula sp. JP-Z28]RLM41312.1 hypothetical protein DVK00_20205 [Haloarcula sp. Atlit-47R]
MADIEYVEQEYTKRWAESEDEHSNQYIPEKYQLGILADYLQSEEIVFTTEARVFSYPIDILAVDGDETIAIEMKARNIGRGIEQARRDADVVDYSYLAVWDHSVSTELENRVEDLSIGLLSIDEDVEVISKAESVSQQLCRKENIVNRVLDDVRDDRPVQEQ